MLKNWINNGLFYRLIKSYRQLFNLDNSLHWQLPSSIYNDYICSDWFGIIIWDHNFKWKHLILRINHIDWNFWLKALLMSTIKTYFLTIQKRLPCGLFSVPLRKLTDDSINQWLNQLYKKNDFSILKKKRKKNTPNWWWEIWKRNKN